MRIKDHLEKLPIFTEVVRCGSIRSASKKLGMSQPAVSRSIQIVEEVLSERLLVRGRTGIFPTESGARLLELAQRIQKELDWFSQSDSESTKELPKIRLGMYESIAVYFFPKFLNFLNEKRASVAIDLVTATSDQLVDLLRKNEVDTILSVNTPGYSNVISKRLFDDYYGFYHSPSLQVTHSTPVIFFPNAKDVDGKKVSTFIKESPLKDNPKFICESFEPIKALANAGLGLGVIPNRVAASEVKSGYLVAHYDDSLALREFGKHTIYFSYLKHRQGDEQIAWLYRTLGRYEEREI